MQISFRIGGRFREANRHNYSFKIVRIEGEILYVKWRNGADSIYKRASIIDWIKCGYGEVMPNFNDYAENLYTKD